MEPGYFQLEFPVRQVASVLEIYFSVFSFQYGCELPYWKFELEIYSTWIFAGRVSVLDLLAFCKICIFVAHACHDIWHVPDFFFQNGCGDTTGNFSGNIHFQNAFSHAHPYWKYTFAPNWKYPDTVYFFQYKRGREAKTIQILEKWGSVLYIVKISSMDPSYWIFFYRFSTDARLSYWKYTGPVHGCGQP